MGRHPLTLFARIWGGATASLLLSALIGAGAIIPLEIYIRSHAEEAPNTSPPSESNPALDDADVCVGDNGDLAISACTRLLDNPSVIKERVYYYRGLSHARKHDPDSPDKHELELAISDYSEAIALDPSYRDAFSARAKALRDFGNVDEATHDELHAFELSPPMISATNGIENLESSEAEAYRTRGDAYKEEKYLDRAIADYSKAIELSPANAAYYELRAKAFRELGKQDEAVADERRMVELDPEIIEASNVIKQSPNDPDSYRRRGDLYEAKNALEKAIDDYSKALALKPDDPAYYNSRAWAYFNAGKSTEGLPDAEKSLSLRPNDADTLDTRGHILEALGKREAAIADYKQALAINPTMESSKEGLNRLGVQDPVAVSSQTSTGTQESPAAHVAASVPASQSTVQSESGVWDWAEDLVDDLGLSVFLAVILISMAPSVIVIVASAFFVKRRIGGIFVDLGLGMIGAVLGAIICLILELEDIFFFAVLLVSGPFMIGICRGLIAVARFWFRTLRRGRVIPSIANN
jgi:tetratricopeptide (TPR) repeat protein